MKKICILGNGSFATALAHVLVYNGHQIYWWIRKTENLNFINQHFHNPNYLTGLSFQNYFSQLTLTTDIVHAVNIADIIVVAVPSAFLENIFCNLTASSLQQKKIVSVVKGIVPSSLTLLNDYLHKKYNFLLDNYIAIAGPCHSEELMLHKNSYLTFSSSMIHNAQQISQLFENAYLRTKVSNDVYGTQYCAVLKNIYAIGMGIAHGLDYGDNFLSVYAINSCKELIRFLKIFHPEKVDAEHYLSSSYLGDLLVTSYSLHSRNRLFGTYVGKGYSIENTKIEMNMVAEGYYALKCLYTLCHDKLHIEMPPFAQVLYEILWKHKNPIVAFKMIENMLK
ncbi:MAG: NAD(P)H-dependent glycerol-3-phosphate dehydrogenase [Chitinophagaceae bacterium]